MTNDVFYPVFPRYWSGRADPQPQARTDIGIAFEAVEGANYYLDGLTSILLRDAEDPASTGTRVPEQAQLAALREISWATRHAFIALRATARAFNRVEGNDSSLLANGDQIFDILNGLKLARDNVLSALRRLNALSAMVTAIVDTSATYKDEQDARWWKTTHLERHATAVRHMEVASVSIDTAIGSLTFLRSQLDKPSKED